MKVNKHKYSLQFVNVTLRLAVELMNFKMKNLFKSSAIRTAKKELIQILSNSINQVNVKHSKINTELVNKVEITIENHNQAALMNNIHCEDIQSDQLKISKITQFEITAYEWASVCKEIINHGRILDLNSLEVNTAWILLLNELAQKQNGFDDNLAECLLKFMGQLITIGHASSAEAIHNFFYLMNKTLFRKLHNGMESHVLADIASSCLLGALEFNGAIIAQVADNYLGIREEMDDYKQMKLISNFFLNHKIFTELFNADDYKKYYQNEINFNIELSKIQKKNWINYDAKSYLKDNELDYSNNFQDNFSKNNSSDLSLSKVNKTSAELFSPYKERKTDDLFAKNFLEPKEAREAYKKIKNEKVLLTTYKEHDVVLVNDNGNYWIYAIKKIDTQKLNKIVKTGAQGPIRVAQQLFENTQNNEIRNIYLCKSTKNQDKIKDFESESKFLRLMSRLKGVYKTKTSYIQISEYLPGDDFEKICYYKDNKGELHKNPLDALFTLQLARGALEAYLHIWQIKKFLHGDVKPSNLIFGSQGVKVIDFGNSTYPLEALSICYGSPGYQAPEMATYSLNQEIFALGITLAALLSKRVYPTFIERYAKNTAKSGWVEIIPYEKITEFMSDVFEPIAKEKKANPTWDLELRKMIQAMTCPEPHKRPNLTNLRSFHKKLKKFEEQFTENTSLASTDVIEVTKEISNLSINNNPTESTILIKEQKSKRSSTSDITPELIHDHKDTLAWSYQSHKKGTSTPQTSEGMTLTMINSNSTPTL